MTDSTQVAISMTFRKSTKGTHVYEGPEDSPIPTLYIRKNGLPASPPVFITVTIEVPNNEKA